MLLSTADAAADFSTSLNPNGPWNYGVRSTEFSDFAQYPVATSLDFGSGAVGWSEGSGSPPYVGVNVTGSEYDSEGIRLPTGVLTMHPGGNGEYTDVRYIIPQTGPTTVAYKFTGIDTNGTTTDEHILYNGTAMKNGNINGYNKSVSGTLSLPDGTAGDIIDFIVGDGSNHTYFSDSTSFEAQITTTPAEDHLVFFEQPRDNGIDNPEFLRVKMVTAKGQLVRTPPGGVTLSLNAPAGVDDTINGSATKYAPFVKGYANFGPQQTVYVETPGAYTFTAEATDASGFVTPFVNSAISKSFTMHGRHIFFLRQPALVGADQLMAFSIRVEDYKNQPAEDSGYLSLQLVDASTGSTVYTDSQIQAAVGLTATYTNNEPQIAYEVPGNYYLLASQPSLDNITAPTKSHTFQITPDHVVFTHQPSTSTVNDPIPFSVTLENGKNQKVNLSEFDQLTLSFTLGSLDADMNLDTDPVHDFSGFYDNLTTTDDNPLGLNAAGTYKLIALVFDHSGSQTAFTPATSKSFVVKVPN